MKGDLDSMKIFDDGLITANVRVLDVELLCLGRHGASQEIDAVNGRSFDDGGGG